MGLWRRTALARARRFYWLWGVAAPLPVGLVVYFLAANLTDAEMILRLVFAAGAAGVVFYIVESFYLRREEKRDKRQSRRKTLEAQGVSSSRARSISTPYTAPATVLANAELDGTRSTSAQDALGATRPGAGRRGQPSPCSEDQRS